MITAKVIADSKRCTPPGVPDTSQERATERLTTLELRYPRLIHSELMTHRVFSRNASSSRAIPVAKLIEQVERDPYVPEAFGRNGKGMQPHGDLEEETYSAARAAWLEAAANAVKTARRLADIGVHKQHANRVLEPFSYITVIVTSSRYENFLALRDSPMAQTEIATLAREIRAALSRSEPTPLNEGEWHLPYVRGEEYGQYGIGTLLQLSVARCARVSFLTHDGLAPSIEGDVGLYQRLSVEQHYSPFEHQAKSDPDGNGTSNFGPFWTQYRKTLDGEWRCGR